MGRRGQRGVVGRRPVGRAAGNPGDRDRRLREHAESGGPLRADDARPRVRRGAAGSAGRGGRGAPARAASVRLGEPPPAPGLHRLAAAGRGGGRPGGVRPRSLGPPTPGRVTARVRPRARRRGHRHHLRPDHRRRGQLRRRRVPRVARSRRTRRGQPKPAAARGGDRGGSGRGRPAPLPQPGRIRVLPPDRQRERRRTRRPASGARPQEPRSDRGPALGGGGRGVLGSGPASEAADRGGRGGPPGTPVAGRARRLLHGSDRDRSAGPRRSGHGVPRPDGHPRAVGLRPAGRGPRRARPARARLDPIARAAGRAAVCPDRGHHDPGGRGLRHRGRPGRWWSARRWR